MYITANLPCSDCMQNKQHPVIATSVTTYKISDTKYSFLSITDIKQVQTVTALIGTSYGGETNILVI
jgi:hypothetical protein